MYFESYPVRRDPYASNADIDHFGRLLPCLPLQRIPTPEYQYRTNSRLELKPDKSVPLDEHGLLVVKITKPIRLGFGFVNQIYECQVVKGPKSLVGRELVALAYDSLYIDMDDLGPMEDDTALESPNRLSAVASTLPQTVNVSPKESNDISTDTRIVLSSRPSTPPSGAQVVDLSTPKSSRTSPEASGWLKGGDDLAQSISDISMSGPTFIDDSSSSTTSAELSAALLKVFKSFGGIQTGPQKQIQLESRSKFVRCTYEREASDYAKLKDFQGDVIPKCYGGYTVNFEDRELHEDKSVNVILVERIRGKRLNEIQVWESTDVQKQQIWNQMQGIMEKLNGQGILLPYVAAEQFILQNHSRKVFVTDFIASIHGGKEMRVTKYGQNEKMRNICSEIGYMSM